MITKQKVDKNTILSIMIIFTMIAFTTILIMNPVFADMKEVAKHLVYDVMFGEIGKSIGIIGIGMGVFTFIVAKFTQNPNGENTAIIMIAVSAALVKGKTLGQAIHFEDLF